MKLIVTRNIIIPNVFFYVNIFISPEDAIGKKLLLFKINGLLFTTYWLSWYGELINIFCLLYQPIYTTNYTV